VREKAYKKFEIGRLKKFYSTNEKRNKKARERVGVH
jgi:hypothetical protein